MMNGRTYLYDALPRVSTVAAMKMVLAGTLWHARNTEPGRPDSAGIINGFRTDTAALTRNLLRCRTSRARHAHQCRFF